MSDESKIERNHNVAANRYARQIQFAPMGQRGQQRLGRSEVAVLGCGALGTVVAELLARAGVGRLRLIDRDVVEWTNLQRQSLFDETDAASGQSKAGAATERLKQINGSIEIEPVVVDVTSQNIAATVGSVDLVIDATDNFAARLLLNDYCLSTETPWVHGGCVGAVGQVCLFRGQGRPCFRCLVPEPPPPSAVETCDTAGVLGAATHMIGSLQAAEAIKWLSDNRDAVSETVLSIDLWRNRIRRLNVAVGPACRACGERRFDFLDCGGTDEQAVALCGRNAVQVSGGTRVDFDQMVRRWQSIGRVQVSPFFVRLHVDGHTLTLFRDGRAVITGTDEPGEARSLYARYVGG